MEPNGTLQNVTLCNILLHFVTFHLLMYVYLLI